VKDPLEPEYAAPPMTSAGTGEATRLMLAAKGGDSRAFDLLVESLRGRAFHVARALVGSRDDAMELTQEAFLKVYKARETFREGEPFLPWFHRILRNACYSFLRDRGRAKETSISEKRPGMDDDAPDYDIADADTSPVDAVESGERAELFWQAFRTLSARDREILSLRHFDDLAYKEIAEALSIPEGTVMSRLFHARRRLRTELEKIPGGPR
jgi:RNA polymerase sigma-70 factor (ECF subfamily)